MFGPRETPPTDEEERLIRLARITELAVHAQGNVDSTVTALWVGLRRLYDPNHVKTVDDALDYGRRHLLPAGRELWVEYLGHQSRGGRGDLKVYLPRDMVPLVPIKHCGGRHEWGRYCTVDTAQATIDDLALQWTTGGPAFPTFGDLVTIPPALR